jgi:hypothetical protein
MQQQQAKKTKTMTHEATAESASSSSAPAGEDLVQTTPRGATDERRLADTHERTHAG